MKDVYTTKDLAEMYSCSLDTARKIMREIKSVSNILNIKGRILKRDLDAWVASKEGEKRWN